MREQLIRKGHKRVDMYMRNRGYFLSDCIETENGYEVEWTVTGAGITLKKVFVVYNRNWRVVDVR